MATESELTLKEVIDALKAEGCQCDLSWRKVKIYDIDAKKFLSFLKEDLKINSDRARVNALSNAKRCIQCRTDELLSLFNLESFAFGQPWKRPWSQRYKLMVLQKFGITAPDILSRRITSKRNILEHQYIIPDEKEIQDVEGIVELFLGASDPFVEQGYIVSATIERVLAEEEVVESTLNLEGKRGAGGRWLHRIKRMDAYLLEFDFDSKEVTLAYVPPYDDVWAVSSKGEVQPRIRRGRDLKRVNTLTIRHCEQEDVTELMILLRKKGK